MQPREFKVKVTLEVTAKVAYETRTLLGGTLTEAVPEGVEPAEYLRQRAIEELDRHTLEAGTQVILPQARVKQLLPRPEPEPDSEPDSEPEPEA